MENSYFLKSEKRNFHKNLLKLLFFLTYLINFTNSENKFYIYSNSSKQNVTKNIEILDVFDYNKHIDDKYKLIYAETFGDFKEKFKNITNVKNMKLVYFNLKEKIII